MDKSYIDTCIQQVMIQLCYIVTQIQRYAGIQLHAFPMLNICGCVAQYIVDMINACNTVCFGCYSVFRFDSSTKHVAYANTYEGTHSNSALHLSSIIQTLNSLADAELYNLTSTPMLGKVQNAQWYLCRQLNGHATHISFSLSALIKKHP